jgi:hypothetical protein
MVGQYAQQGPRAPWQNNPLGHGGRPGTIGQFGCYVTSFADIATWAGIPTDPGQMNDIFNARNVYVPEADGTYDMMPGDDNALGRAFPGRFEVAARYAGLNAAAIAAALPSPDLYTVLGLGWTAGGVFHTHFLPVVGGTGPDFLVGDSWDGVTKRLSAYGLSAVTKTVIIRALPDPAVAAAAAAAAQAAADAAAKARVAAEEAAAAERARVAAEEAAKAKADAEAAQAAEDARVIAEAAARAAADAAAQAEAAQAAHDKAIEDAMRAAAGKATPSWLEALIAFLVALFRSAGHAQAALVKAKATTPGGYRR